MSKDYSTATAQLLEEAQKALDDAKVLVAATPKASQAGFNTRIANIQKAIDARLAVILTEAAENAVKALEVDYTAATTEELAKAKADLAEARKKIALAPEATRAGFNTRIDAVVMKMKARQVVLDELAKEKLATEAAENAVKALEVDYTAATTEELTKAKADLAEARKKVALAPEATQADFNTRIDAVVMKMKARQVVLNELAANQLAVKAALPKAADFTFPADLSNGAQSLNPILNLPTVNVGLKIDWTLEKDSNSISFNTKTGAITRPMKGMPAVNVILIATVTAGSGDTQATATQKYNIIIPAGRGEVKVEILPTP